MAHGDNHAKKVVLGQADTVVNKLNNGHKSDPETHGEGILLCIQMIRPLFEARFITEEACKERMEDCKIACIAEAPPAEAPPAEAPPAGNLAKLTIGHWSVAGTSGVIVTGMICFTLLQLFDKWPW